MSNVSHWKKLLTFLFYFFNFPLLLCVGILQVGAVCASDYADYVLLSRETSYLRLVAWLRKKNAFKVVNTAVEEVFSISFAVCFNTKRHNYRSLQKCQSVKHNWSLVYVFPLRVYMSSDITLNSPRKSLQMPSLLSDLPSWIKYRIFRKNNLKVIS